MLPLLVVLLVYSTGVQATCDESDQLECASSTRCTRLQYICDGDNDCGDYSDENSELCEAWRNSDCSRGEALCNRDGSRSCMAIKEYCVMTHPLCEGDLDRRICQMLSDEKLQELDDIILPSTRRAEQDGGVVITANLNDTFHRGEDFMSVVPDTIKHDKCPLLYTQVDNECISFFFFGNMTWGEANKFCQVIGGQLYVPKEESSFDVLTHHIRDHAITSDFWIGGNFYNNTRGWRWINGEPMQLNSNHWAIIHGEECYTRDVTYTSNNVTVTANDGVCYNYYQAPYVSNPLGSCVAMTYKQFYFMGDEDCNLRKSPLCKISKESI